MGQFWVNECENFADPAEMEVKTLFLSSKTVKLFKNWKAMLIDPT